MTKWIRPSKVLLFFLFIAATHFIPHTVEICEPPGTPEFCSKEMLRGLGYPPFVQPYAEGDVIGYHFSWLNLFINLIAFCLMAEGVFSMHQRLKASKSKKT